jgi:hypothetical protein
VGVISQLHIESIKSSHFGYRFHKCFKLRFHILDDNGDSVFNSNHVPSRIINMPRYRNFSILSKFIFICALKKYERHFQAPVFFVLQYSI